MEVHVGRVVMALPQPPPHNLRGDSDNMEKFLKDPEDVHELTTAMVMQ
jgi:hypothetical protein